MFNGSQKGSKNEQLTESKCFPGGSMVKNPLASAGNTGDKGSILGSGRVPGGGNSSPLQYSFLGNPMDRGAWWATVHAFAKSQTRLSHQACTKSRNKQKSENQRKEMESRHEIWSNLERFACGHKRNTGS